MKKLFVTLVAITAMLICQAATAVDATSVWNQHCGQYHFALYPQLSTVTFAQAYTGSDLAGDFAAIKGVVDSTVLSIGSGSDEDDLLNATLEDWN